MIQFYNGDGAADGIRKGDRFAGWHLEADHEGRIGCLEL